MKAASKATLINARLKSAGRENERLRIMMNVQDAIATGIRRELIDAGWDDTMATQAVLQRLGEVASDVSREVFA